MRAALAVVVSLALTGCAFYADQALFARNETTAPFADGARFSWFENGRARETVTYRRAGEGYEVRQANGEDAPMRVEFIPVRQTPDEDYVVQVAMDRTGDGRIYAFMWRTDEGFRIVAAPAVAEESALARYCATRPNGECGFARREDLLAFYRAAIYPEFVAGGVTPADYLDQVPVAAETSEKPQHRVSK